MTCSLTCRSLALQVLLRFYRPAVLLCLVLLQIQFLSDCDHPNVVRYLGSFRQPDALWIVMEHCGGGSVGDLLQVCVCWGGGRVESRIVVHSIALSRCVSWSTAGAAAWGTCCRCVCVCVHTMI